VPHNGSKQLAGLIAGVVLDHIDYENGRVIRGRLRTCRPAEIHDDARERYVGPVAVKSPNTAARGGSCSCMTSTDPMFALWSCIAVIVSVAPTVSILSAALLMRHCFLR
jgi:hypothetical protein